MAIKKFRNNKYNIYVDADDTILQSSKAVIQIINKKYNLIPPKTIDDLRTWNYACICSKVTQKDVKEIYSSDEFFALVQADPVFVEVYEKFKEYFNFIVVTKGSKLNLDQKEEWFKKHFPGMYFVGMELTEDEDFDKSIITMKGGIQVDDRADSLRTTNAECKILLRNGKEFPWNKTAKGDGIYIVNKWEEIGDILEFTLKYPSWYTLFND